MISAFISVLREDLRAYALHAGLKDFCKSWVHSGGFRPVVLFRFQSALTSHSNVFTKFFIFKLRSLLLSNYGIEFGPGCQIGPGLKIGHPYGIVIGGGAIIGANAIIMQGVTIGESNVSLSSSHDYPVIGNNVIIGCNSAILGKIVVGKNVKVMSFSLILKNVSDNSIVIGLWK